MAQIYVVFIYLSSIIATSLLFGFAAWQLKKAGGFFNNVREEVQYCMSALERFLHDEAGELPNLLKAALC